MRLKTQSLFLFVVHNSVWNSASPFQQHFVRVDMNCAKGLAVGSCFNNSFKVDVVYTKQILRVAAVMCVASKEAHHTLVRPYDRQGIHVVPSQAHTVRGLRVNGKVAC